MIRRAEERADTSPGHGLIEPTSRIAGISLAMIVNGRSGFKRKMELHALETEAVRTIFKLAKVGDAGEPWGIERLAAEMNRRARRSSAARI